MYKQDFFVGAGRKVFVRLPVFLHLKPFFFIPISIGMKKISSWVISVVNISVSCFSWQYLTIEVIRIL